MGLEYYVPVLLFDTTQTPITPNQDQAGFISAVLVGVSPLGGCTASFDLGPNWNQYPNLVFNIYLAAPTVGMGTVYVLSGDTYPVTTTDRRAKDPNVAGINFMATSAGVSVGSIGVRSAGRVARILFTNSDAVNSVVAGSKITLTAYPA